MTAPRDELVERIKRARRAGLTAAEIAAEVRAWIRERMSNETPHWACNDLLESYANQILARVRERLGL